VNRTEAAVSASAARINSGMRTRAASLTGLYRRSENSERAAISFRHSGAAAAKACIDA